LDNKYKPRELSRHEEEATRRLDNPPPAPATVYEDLSGEDELPQYSTRPPSPAPHPRRPEPARVLVETRGGPKQDRKVSGSRGFFGFRGRWLSDWQVGRDRRVPVCGSRCGIRLPRATLGATGPVWT
jgi:hypothetical protein